MARRFLRETFAELALLFDGNYFPKVPVGYVLPLIVTVGAVEVCLNVTPAKLITSSFFGSSNSIARVEASRLRMSVRPLKDVSFKMSRTTFG